MDLSTCIFTVPFRTQAKKDSVVAEVKWFYRVSELPEAVYLLLSEDRKNGNRCIH